MTSTDTSLAKPARRVSNLLILLLLLSLALIFRLYSLDSHGYELDEVWTAELASGRGSPHLTFPLGQLLQPPELFSLSNAPPWWKVWTRMQTTHPPLYYISLRLWMEAFGQGDQTERLFSVLASLAAIALLFDITRLTSGRNIAIWACLLMAVAPLQIDYARKSRNYALAFVTMLAAMDALVRIEKLGVSRRRLLALMLGVLATPLTHYFSVGAMLGLAIYAAIRFKGSTRVKALTAFAAAGAIYAIIWGPFYLRQLPFLSVDDPAMTWVKDNAPGHVQRVIELLLLVPAKLLVPRANLNPAANVLALLYVVPFLLLRRRKDLLLWGLMLVATVGVITLLDLTRSSLHLGFVRYLIFAGPAVYVLIPAIAFAAKMPQWLRPVLPAMAVAVCLCFAGDGYYQPAADPRIIAAGLKSTLVPADVIVFASAGDFAWTRGVQAMTLDRYLRPIPCPILFLERPPSRAIRQKLLAARSVVVFTSSQSPETFLPGFERTSTTAFPSWGTVSIMIPPSPASHATE